jgi:hypothetical protein
MGILPLSAGLLISMAIRKDHSFGIRTYLHPDSKELDCKALSDKQIRLIRQARLDYEKINLLINEKYPDISKEEPGELLSSIEEARGFGYYKPELEQVYRGWATDEALIEALRLATEKAEYDGIKPTVTIETPLDFGIKGGTGYVIPKDLKSILMD